MSDKWAIPPRGNEKEALRSLLRNDQRLHSQTPATIPSGATLEEVTKKVNELLAFLSNNSDN